MHPNLVNLQRGMAITVIDRLLTEEVDLSDPGQRYDNDHRTGFSWDFLLEERARIKADIEANTL